MSHWPEPIALLYLKLFPGERNGVAEMDVCTVDFTLNLRSVTFPERRKIIKIRLLLARKEGRNRCE